MKIEDIKKKIECENFYNIMQQYRHALLFPQKRVIEAYEAVKEYIAKTILQDREEIVDSNAI